MAKAKAVVTHYLTTQSDALRDRADDVRADAPDAVHKSRVATRRSRSVLRTYGPVFQASRRKKLRRELAWYAGVLGPARDAEVLRERLLGALDGLPEADLARPIRERLGAELTDQHARAHAYLVAAMGSARFATLLGEFATFADDPPARKPGRRDASTILPPLWRAAIETVAALVRDAEEAPADLARWHEVRKAAKAARYGSEALTPVTAAANGHAKAWEQVTESLGEVQDTVVAEAALEQHRARAEAAGEPTQTYDRLLDRERALRADALTTGRSAVIAAVARSRAVRF